MSIQAQIAQIAARGLEAIDKGTTLLPQFTHRTDSSVINPTSKRKPNTMFLANNY